MELERTLKIKSPRWHDVPTLPAARPDAAPTPPRAAASCPEPASGALTVPTHPPGPGLPLTGERTLPGIADERYWFERHLAGYHLAATHVAPGATVLDAGCGEGYGLTVLAAAGAARVVGVDLDAPTVAHARASYAADDPRIEVHRAELKDLPLADAEVELTVSLQVIEHVWDVPGTLASLARVTRPGGHVLLATPNRLTFTPGSDTPVNPFHVREFTADELVAEVTGCHLEVVEVVGLHHGPRLTALDERLGRPVPQVLGDLPPERWPAHLRDAVHATTWRDLEVRDDDLDASLDLVLLARVPARPATYTSRVRSSSAATAVATTT
jgi:SAM-dependent methyltransferase